MGRKSCLVRGERSMSEYMGCSEFRHVCNNIGTVHCRESYTAEITAPILKEWLRKFEGLSVSLEWNHVGICSHYTVTCCCLFCWMFFGYNASLDTYNLSCRWYRCLYKMPWQSTQPLLRHFPKNQKGQPCCSARRKFCGFANIIKIHLLEI